MRVMFWNYKSYIVTRHSAYHTAMRPTTMAMPTLLTVLLLAFLSTSVDGQTPTFSRDIAPILQRSCQQCHRPGAIAPMSLLSYQDARPWAKSIKAKVTAREMPPWYIDRHVGIQK